MKTAKELVDELKPTADELKKGETPEAQLIGYVHEQYCDLVRKATELGLGRDTIFNALMTNILAFAANGTSAEQRNGILRGAIGVLQHSISQTAVLDEMIARATKKKH
jgi:hypothetical protein